MNQNAHISSGNLEQFSCSSQNVNSVKKLQRIDSDKRVTSIGKKCEDQKVMIGRRNGIGRISTRIRRQLINSQYLKSLREQKSLDSSIITDLGIIQRFFQTQLESRLLYRATQNNFSVKTFHQLCDGIPNTLVICKTQSENVIGGFTSLTWDCEYQANKTYFKTDPQNLTFIFSVTDNQKYQIKKTPRNKSICCFNKYGPTFGGGYDLCIGDNAGVEATSISYFPRNFQSKGKSNQEKNFKFTGCNKNNFKLKEWQVFQLKFKDRQHFLQAIRQEPRILRVDDFRPKKTENSTLHNIKQYLRRIFHISHR